MHTFRKCAKAVAVIYKESRPWIGLSILQGMYSPNDYLHRIKRHFEGAVQGVGASLADLMLQINK